MSRSFGKVLAAALISGVAASPVLAASAAMSQYQGAEDQIKNYFRQNFGQASANCGPGEINDISDAKVVSESASQVVMEVSYTFSARSLQNTNTCSGTQTSTVTFDKNSNGQLSLSQMAGLNP